MIDRFFPQALASLRPGALWMMRDDDLTKLDWQDARQERPTDDEIITEASRLETEQSIKANIDAMQAELDRQAKDKGYDNIVSACSYAAGPEGDPFAAEGRAFLAWRSAVWTEAYRILAEVRVGARPMPTPAQSVAAMPPLVLPS